MNKKQFFYLFNNALKITIDNKPKSIFYVYNKSIERQLKYNRLFNSKKPIKYNFNKKDILFEHEQKNKYLWYDYKKIYLKLKENNDYKDLDVNDLIDAWLKLDNRMLYPSVGVRVDKWFYL
jgi:hypothetical protein